MNLRARSFLVCGSAITAVFLALPAHAQTTTTTTGALISPSAQQFPERFVGGHDVGQSTRPQNLTPLGVNFDDCISDMTLQFNAIVTLPAGSGDTVQAWATNTGDCAATTARGNSAVATCWRLNAGLGAQTLTNSPESFVVRVQDIIGGLATVGQNPNAAVSAGSSACSLQSSFAATTFQVEFLAIEPDGVTSDGTPWDYALPVDLQGPPPPVLNNPGIGDTLLIVSWTANSDSDTGGYDVFVDPPPGSPAALNAAAEGGAASAGDAATLSDTVLVCPPEAGTSATSTSSSDSTSSSTSSVSASTTSSSSADDIADAAAPGCHLETVPPANGANSCTSTVFASSSIVVDSGLTLATTGTTVAPDGAIVSVDDAATTETGNGGITTITCDFLVGTSCPAGQPAYTATNESVTGESSGNFNLTGLSNSVKYNVTVAAVDNFGNIGPLATQVCAQPQPVNDFFKTYRLAGGEAGGGYCAVDSVGHSVGWGVGIGAAAIAVVGGRRRRRRHAR
jgi:hypothetical protein